MIRMGLALLILFLGVSAQADRKNCHKSWKVFFLPEIPKAKNSPQVQALLKLRKDMDQSFDKTFCVDHRRYLAEIIKLISQFEQRFPSMATGPQKFLERLKHRLRLPSYESMSLLAGDARRAAKFSKRFFEHERSETARLERGDDPEIVRDLSQIQVILVAGYMGEYVDSYFEDFEVALKEHLAVPPEQIRKVFTVSHRGADHSSELVKEAITDLAKNEKPIVIIGHSRGGQVSLNTLAQNMEFFRNGTVRSLVTVQSPLQGTEIATAFGHVLKVASAVNSLWSFGLNEGKSESISSGAYSMDPERAKKTWKKLFESLSHDDQNILSSRLFFVTSKDHEPTKPGTYIIDHSDHDGTVPYKSQFLPNVGHRLADLNAGHTDTVLGGSHSDWSAEKRRAFAIALMEVLTDPDLLDPSPLVQQVRLRLAGAVK